MRKRKTSSGPKVAPRKRPPLPKGRLETEDEPKMSELARYACKWIETLIRTDEGEPFKIARYQTDVLRDIYATYSSGDRMCNRYVLSIGRKMGKTTLAAAINLFEMSSKYAPKGGWFFAAAAGSKDQAMLVYNKMQRMVEMEQRLRKRYFIAPSAKKITDLRKLNTLEALSTSARSAQGREAYGFTFDEYAQARDNALLDALEKSGRRVSAGTGLIISTNSTVPGNPMLELLELIKASHAVGQLREWQYRVYAPDLKIVEWDSDDAIFAANPGLYEKPPMVEWQLIENDRIKARRAPSEKKNYIAYRLNAQSATDSALVDPHRWAEFQVQEDGLEQVREEHKGQPCVVGMDLSKTTDMSAVVALFPRTGFVKSMAWLPEKALHRLEAFDKAPYSAWKEMGWLRTSEGNTVDYEDLVAYIHDELMTNYDVQEVRYDPYNFIAYEHAAKGRGIDVKGIAFGEMYKPFRQGYVTFTPAISALEKRIVEGQLMHEGDPILTMAITTMKIKDTGNKAADARSPEKAYYNHRIDTGVALIMASLPIEIDAAPVDPAPSDSFMQRLQGIYG